MKPFFIKLVTQKTDIYQLFVLNSIGNLNIYKNKKPEHINEVTIV